jgi:hypothetical protein
MHRLPTDDEIEAFWRDGAVVLRCALGRDEVAGMVPHVDALIGRTELVDMTAMGDALGRSGASVLRDESTTGSPIRRSSTSRARRACPRSPRRSCAPRSSTSGRTPCS